MPHDDQTISIQDAESMVVKALEASKVSRAAALSVAHAIVAAEAEGQIGHGFSRLSDYAAQAKSGKVNGHAEPTCRTSGPAALHIDAQNGFAYPALDLAVMQGIRIATAQGVAYMTVTRSHHCGALSVQVDRIAQAGLIGMMVANSPPAIAPWGASTPLFGTNPIAFAAPRPGGASLVVDLSLSVVARGKVMHAHKSGSQIPLGWALDAKGNPTTDPEQALAGSMIPIGGAKGTALALIVEILSAVVTGANPSADVSSFFTADGPPPGSGQFLIAIKPHDAAAFGDRIERVLARIEALDGARLPGTHRIAALNRAQEFGITVPGQYLEIARSLAMRGI